MITFYNNLINKKNFLNISEIDNIYCERIYLKLLQESDLNELEKSMTKEISMNLGGSTPWPYGIEDAKDFLKRSLEAREKNNFYNYVIREKNTNEFIGLITPFIKQYSTCLYQGKISYWAAENKRKNGFISEALKKIEEMYKKYFLLNKIWTSVRADNIKSSNLLLKNNYIKTGSRWENYFNSEYVWEEIFEKNL